MLNQCQEIMLVMLSIRLNADFFLTFKTFLFFSEILGKNIRLKVTSKGIKTVEKNGGIDNYILGLKNSLLNDQTRKIKKILSTKKPS